MCFPGNLLHLITNQGNRSLQLLYRFLVSLSLALAKCVQVALAYHICGHFDRKRGSLSCYTRQMISSHHRQFHQSSSRRKIFAGYRDEQGEEVTRKRQKEGKKCEQKAKKKVEPEDRMK